MKADASDAVAKVFSGRCLCGNISYQAQNLKPLWFCHCRQCRQATGHFMAASQVALSDITITGEVKWYYAYEKAKHGFCPDCGSQLFWRHDNENYLSITAGGLDETKDLVVKGHLYTSEKGDYYQIDDDLLHLEKFWHEQ